MKRCSCCKNFKNYDKFATDVSHADNVRSQCKDCINDKAKDYRSKKKNEKEKITCEYCNTTISDKNELKRHQKTNACLKAQGQDVSDKTTSKSKKVYQIEPNTGKILNEYESISEASKQLEMSRTTIIKYCNTNSIYKNYMLKYDE